MTTENFWCDPRQWKEFYSSRKRSDRHWALPIPYFMLTGGSFHGLKRPERGTDHLTPSSTKVSNALNYTHTHPIMLHGVDGETSPYLSKLTVLLVFVSVTNGYNCRRFNRWLRSYFVTVNFELERCTVVCIQSLPQHMCGKTAFCV